MKPVIAALILAVAAATHGVLLAQESSPAKWLLMPFAAQVTSCSKYGPEMRERLRAALATAQENSRKTLPASAWELIGHGLATQENQAPAPGALARCEAMLTLFEDNRFSNHFRQMVAAQFVASPALQCIVQQPGTESKLREAWLAAFTRQGFILTEQTLDELVSRARKQLKSQPGSAGPSRSDCEQIAEQLSSRQFEERFSDSGIYSLFEAK